MGGEHERQPGLHSGVGASFCGIVGDSLQMRELYRQVERVAAADVSVLLHGESGTGKELVARAIHHLSPLSDGPFVALNCAAVAETLQESELFGHEKGAFTGADKQRLGRLEQADGGTLFLDEVAELSPSLQAKLLRALQERVFTRVGGNVEIRSRFRLVAATHRDLSAEVEAGRFREDLFFRVAVFECELPPLRERRGDVQRLAAHFLDQLGPGGARQPISPAALQVLEKHRWPGNVRELMNALQRASVMAAGEPIRPADLPPRVQRGADQAQSEQLLQAVAEASPATANGNDPRSIEDIERAAIEAALVRHKGNLSTATRELGLARSTLYRKLKKYGLR